MSLNDNKIYMNKYTISFLGSSIRYAPLTYNVDEEQGYVTVYVVITEPYFEDFNVRIFDSQFSSPINGFAISKKTLYISFYAQFLFLGGSDYTGFNMTMTISANQESFSFNVTIIDNNILELFEVFGLGLEVMGFPRIDVDGSIVNARVSINDVDSKCLRHNQLYQNCSYYRYINWL